MAKSTNYKFTNTTANMDLTNPAQYAPIADEAGKVVLSNVTTPVDAEEVITLQGKFLGNRSNSLNINAAHLPSANYVQVVVKDEAVLRTEDSAAGTIYEDDPVIVYTTICVPRSANVTGTLVGDLKARVDKVISLKGIDSLLRLALQP